MPLKLLIAVYKLNCFDALNLASLCAKILQLIGIAPQLLYFWYPDANIPSNRL